MKYSFFILSIAVLISCKKNEPRYPVNYENTSLLEKSVAINKALFMREHVLIEHFIARDTSLTYTNSQKGFWYAKISENKKGVYPVKGDVVLFEKEVTSLDGTVYFSTQGVGLQEYCVDKEHIIKGIKEGIKLMREGETYKFVFSSFVAYRMNGDATNTVGSNEPLVCTISLTKINKNN